MPLLDDAPRLFQQQLFRRIGYTVGLWKIREFTSVCALLRDKGAQDRNQLIRLISHSFKLRSGDAQGKVDVALSLGLLFSVGQRVALSALGRALVALAALHGDTSAEVDAFLLKRIADRDGDITLVLLTATLQPHADLPAAFALSLDRLLRLKRALFAPAVPLLSLRREVTRILTVRESQGRAGLRNRSFAAQLRARNVTRPYATIDIPDKSLPHYLRHTIGPRKGWLSDLGLLDKRAHSVGPAEKGHNLLAYLSLHGKVLEGVPVLEPEERVMMAIAGVPYLVGDRAINETFYNELLSFTYTARTPRAAQLAPQEFVDLLRAAYNEVRLASFEQAELEAVREVILTGYLVRGECLDFDSLVEQAVQLFPDKLYRLSSRRKGGAYISFKRASRG